MRKLWAVFACGGTLWFFAAAGAETGGYGRPSRSPDGRRLAMEVTDGSGQDIRVYDLERRRGADNMNRINQIRMPKAHTDPAPHGIRRIHAAGDSHVYTKAASDRPANR